MDLTPQLLAEYLKVMRQADVMSARIDTESFDIQVTMGPGRSSAEYVPLPEGWKEDASDPLDPDPLGLGSLDAPFAHDGEIPE